ncbi:unnamed protein product [Protopolystoma xenopodis]|uniref:Uncharacterized protein n=1 Tax=Protopolystoma xenopodis TaxID=117903 RepID=A0A3S5ALL1_9PLAT|nr:unnamed protein product [Protopolystoma xenopodis]
MSTVDRSTLANLPSLLRLDLSSNRFLWFSPDWLPGAGQLSYLSLSYNQIAGLSPNLSIILPELRQLHLVGNQFTRLRRQVPLREHLRNLKVTSVRFIITPLRRHV